MTLSWIGVVKGGLHKVVKQILPRLLAIEYMTKSKVLVILTWISQRQCLQNEKRDDARGGLTD